MDIYIHTAFTNLSHKLTDTCDYKRAVIKFKMRQTRIYCNNMIIPNIPTDKLISSSLIMVDNDLCNTFGIFIR